MRSESASRPFYSLPQSHNGTSGGTGDLEAMVPRLVRRGTTFSTAQNLLPMSEQLHWTYLDTHASICRNADGTTSKTATN